MRKYITLRDCALSIRRIVRRFLSKLTAECVYFWWRFQLLCLYVALTLNSRALSPLASLSPGDNVHAYYAERAHVLPYVFAFRLEGWFCWGK